MSNFMLSQAEMYRFTTDYLSSALFCFIYSLIQESHEQSRRVPSRNSGTESNPVRRPQPGSTVSPARTTARPHSQPSDDDDDDGVEEAAKFECPKQDGLFADPNSCKRFYICGAGHPYSQACPPSLYFDDRLKFCTFKTAQLACGPVNDEESQLPKDLKQSNNPVCNRETCRLPNCYCSEDGTAIPGGLNPDQVPQMVLLAFSGAVNELVFEQYKKVLGYNNKFVTTQSKLNPNGCGVKATFFINHEYSNYAEIQWLATQGHEIGIHSITHRLPELWWTDKANYSEWAEEIIGMREILLKFANGGATTNGVLSRENVVGMRAPYVKPGGDAMFEMAHDFGLLYDSSLVAPRGNTPLWPFTFDHRQPFSCGESPNKPENGKDASETSSGTENAGIGFRGGAEIRQKRDTLVESKLSKKKVTQVMKKNLNRKSRVRRENPFLGRPLKCPLKSFPGLWEVPVNPLFNEFNTCPHADQCVFPSSDETEDPSDIVEFLNENFQRHYSSNRAPFQVNFHVNWFTSKTKVKALSRFIEHILKTYKDAYFVTFRQMIQWMKEPQPLSTLNFKCENRTNVSTCNRQHTCVLKHFVDKDGVASTQEASVASDVRYMGVCHPTTCPQHYPWYGNHAGAARNLKTVMQLVEEAVGPDEKNS